MCGGWWSVEGGWVVGGDRIRSIFSSIDVSSLILIHRSNQPLPFYRIRSIFSSIDATFAMTGSELTTHHHSWAQHPLIR